MQKTLRKVQGVQIKLSLRPLQDIILLVINPIVTGHGLYLSLLTLLTWDMDFIPQR